MWLLILGMNMVMSEDIKWLVPTHVVQVESSVQILRISVSAMTNVTLTELKQLILTVDASVKAFKLLPIFGSGSTLRPKYLKAIKPGELYLAELGQLYTKLFSFMDLTRDRKQQANCSLQYDLIDAIMLTEGDIMLRDKTAALVEPPMDETAFKADSTKMLALEEFVFAFNTMTLQWHQQASEAIAELDVLESLTFPESMRGKLETASCFPRAGAEYEQIRVLLAESGRRGIRAELEISVPKTYKDMEYLIPISYGGYQLRGSDTTHGQIIYAQPVGTNQIQLLNCSNNLGYTSENNLLCHDIQMNENCKGGLQQFDNEKVLKYCSFTCTEAPGIVRLKDDSLLIQGTDYMVIEGGKTIYTPPPFVIYTNEELKVSTKDQEFVFPALTTSDRKTILVSTLSKLQILEMKTKAHWDNFAYNFNFLEYLDWLALGIEGLLAPLTLIGICLGVRRRVAQRQNSKLAKQQRKRNQRETRALLRESRL